MNFSSILTRPTPDLVPVKENPEFQTAREIDRKAKEANTAARIDAGQYPVEMITRRSIDARDRYRITDEAATAARQAFEAVEARLRANIIEAYAPQIQAALKRFYQHLTDEVVPLAEEVRSIQLARNGLLGGGGVELPGLVGMMLDGGGAFNEPGRLSVEAAPFLGGN